MKTEKKVIAASVFLGLLAGFIDAVLDYLFFYRDQSFWGILIIDVPRHEIYVRFAIFICSVIFGLVCAKIISRLKKTEAEKGKLIEKLQKTLSEVKTLRGLLPICASCKKIRDDTGFWNNVESYLKKHAEVEFSHGICPDCARKFYPELYDSEEKDEQ